MLTITIPKQEVFSNKTNEFLYLDETTLQLEHSLISLKKWEEKWHKPFLNSDGTSTKKSYEEIKDYVRCMTIKHSKPFDDRIYHFIPANLLEEVIAYIKDPRTATRVNENALPKGTGKNGEGITAEVIYYWMISLQIPVEFEKWHLNSLMTLIKVVNIKNAPRKKMGKKEEQEQRAALNAARRAKHRSKG